MSKKIAFIMVALLSHLAFANTTSPKRTLEFPDLHYNNQKKTGKGSFRDLAFGGNNIVWLIDDQYLWRWNFLTNSLKKINLSLADTVSMHALGHLQNEVVIFAEQVIYLINVDNLKIKRVLNPSLGIQGPSYTHNHGLFWSDRSSAWFFDAEKRIVQRVTPLAGIRATDLVARSEKSGITFIARENLIIASTKKAGQTQQKILHKANTRFIDLYVDSSEDLYFITKDVVLRLSSTGEILQAIPVLDREIIAADINDKFHSYFLTHDGLLEVYDKEHNMKFTYTLPKRNIKKLRVKKNFVIGLDHQGRPFVSHIEMSP